MADDTGDGGKYCSGMEDPSVGGAEQFVARRLTPCPFLVRDFIEEGLSIIATVSFTMNRMTAPFGVGDQGWIEIVFDE